MNHFPNWFYFVALIVYYGYQAYRKFQKKAEQAKPVSVNSPTEVRPRKKAEIKQIPKEELSSETNSYENIAIKNDKVQYVSIEDWMAKEQNMLERNSNLQQHSVFGKNDQSSFKMFDTPKKSKHTFLKNIGQPEKLKEGIIWSMILEPKFKS